MRVPDGWHLVRANNKRSARIQVFETVRDALPSVLGVDTGEVETRIILANSVFFGDLARLLTR